jgi:hypothetical protein
VISSRNTSSSATLNILSSGTTATYAKRPTVREQSSTGGMAPTGVVDSAKRSNKRSLAWCRLVVVSLTFHIGIIINVAFGRNKTKIHQQIWLNQAKKEF